MGHPEASLGGPLWFSFTFPPSPCSARTLGHLLLCARQEGQGSDWAWLAARQVSQGSDQLPGANLVAVARACDPGLHWAT